MRLRYLRNTAMALLAGLLLLWPGLCAAYGTLPTEPGPVSPPDLDPGEYLSFIWFEMTGEWLEFSIESVDETSSVAWEGDTRYWVVRDSHGNLHVIYVGDYNSLFAENTELAEGVVLDDMWGSLGNSINAYWCLLTGLCGEETPDWPTWVWMPEVEQSWIVVPPYGKGIPGDGPETDPVPVPELPGPPPAPGPMPGPATEEPTVHIHFGIEVVNPVVVGQDPELRGADFFLTVTVPPVIYTYELEQRVQRCIYSDTPPSDWDGCDLDTDGDGSPDHPGDPSWNEGSESVWLTQHQAVPDQLVLTPNTWDFRATLTEESRSWIMGELRTHYPNAVIAHPEWDLSRTERFEITANAVSGDLRAILRMQTTYVPIVDPGVYEVMARFRTRGTEFQCPGNCRDVRVTMDGRTLTTTRTEARVLEAHRELKAWMHDARLVQ